MKNCERIVIGGEFECQPISNTDFCIKTTNLNPYTYASGRTALYHILRSCKQNFGITKVYLPDYLCSCIIDVVEMVGFNYDFYPVNKGLHVDYQDLVGIREGGVLLINYFGIIDTEPTISKLKILRPDIVLIKDLSQAPYQLNEDSKADYQFTSFRKAFAVPDGAWVITNHSMYQPTTPSKFSQYKLAASILKASRSLGYYDDLIYLKMYERGEELINTDIEDGDMSEYSKITLRATNWQKISMLRKRNAKIVLDGLMDLGIQTLAPVSENDTPLFVPIWLENRDTVRQAMFAHNIFLPVHWPIEKCDERLKSGREYAERELSVIVDHRYAEDDMMQILDIIAQYNK